MEAYDTKLSSSEQKTKEKILLIDKDARAMRLVYEMLEGLGYRVISFIDFYMAIEWYKNRYEDISLVAIGISNSKLDNHTQDHLKTINPDLKALFYQRGMIAPGLYTCNVDKKGFKRKIDFLLNN